MHISTTCDNLLRLITKLLEDKLQGLTINGQTLDRETIRAGEL